MPRDRKADTKSHYVTSTLSGERVRAFIPPPLPPGPEAVDLTSLQGILAEANQAVGRLDGMTSVLPDLKLYEERTSVVSLVRDYPLFSIGGRCDGFSYATSPELAMSGWDRNCAKSPIGCTPARGLRRESSLARKEN